MMRLSILYLVVLYHVNTTFALGVLSSSVVSSASCIHSGSDPAIAVDLDDAPMFTLREVRRDNSKGKLAPEFRSGSRTSSCAAGAAEAKGRSPAH